ncbi:MAG: hypothetical protein R3C10_07505 [Pirellulales bacterium]
MWPNETQRSCDAQRAQQAAQRRPQQNAGVPNPEAEVERFLREVSRNRGGAAAAPQPAVPAEIILDDDILDDDALAPVRSQRTQKRKQGSPKRTPTGSRTQSAPAQRADVGASIESRHLSGTLGSRPARHSQLELADEMMAEHVHEALDHQLGQFGAASGAAPPAPQFPEVVQGALPRSAGASTVPSLTNVVAMLRDPRNVRQAILIHEILGPPRCQQAYQQPTE